MPIVECVPNFSEGRRPEVIDAIAGAAKAQDVRVLDVETDADHNRMVLTFVGEPEPVAEAAFQAVATAVDLIDLNEHEGEHPRLGAADVVPFIPIAGVTMDDCVELANRVGERIATELKVPVYLYEHAATRPDRQNLAAIRKGEFEGLREAIGTDPDRVPDYGAARVHPTAGATVVGARDPLIAYNVNLGTDDLGVAKKIAKAVRHSSGGLRYVKALGFALEDRGIVQVSMNLVNYRGTPIHRAYEMVAREAARYGVPVVGSEVVGLLPLDALVDAADYYLKLEGFQRDQILEVRLWE